MAKKTKPAPPEPAPILYIAEDLRPLAVPIDSLAMDPRNARKHDERNIQSIANSLARFGQRKPIVVNTETGTIEAGNGTLAAAISIGWTHIAVVRVKDDPTAQTGFALADNRTAELAVWDDAMLIELAAEVRAADQDLFDDLLIEELLGESEEEDEPADPVNYDLRYQVIVECADEAMQVAVLERMEGEGYKCRALIS